MAACGQLGQVNDRTRRQERSLRIKSKLRLYSDKESCSNWWRNIRLNSRLWFKKNGISVDLYERSASIMEFAGITLSKNATSLLVELDLMNDISSVAYFPMKSFVRNFVSVREISSVEFDKSFVTLDRRDLIRILAHRFELSGGKLILDTEVNLVNP